MVRLRFRFNVWGWIHKPAELTLETQFQKAEFSVALLGDADYSVTGFVHGVTVQE